MKMLLTKGTALLISILMVLSLAIVPTMADDTGDIRIVAGDNVITVSGGKVSTGSVSAGKEIKAGVDSNNADAVATEAGDYVAKIGDVNYATLAEAFAAAQNGDTVTLLADIAIDSETYTIADGVAVTLDMNGKKITVTDNKTANYELFYIYGEMTVTGIGAIELTSTNDREWNAMSAIFHNRGGVLTIENGTFKNLGGTDMAWVVDNSGNWYGDATCYIKGGRTDFENNRRGDNLCFFRPTVCERM